tara:strand:+ start:33 stop:323 length:291 start_codon:yes stop_codon:yes gene_type:complete
MNNQKEKLKNLKEKIDSSFSKQNQNNANPKNKSNAASFGFKISTEIVAALVVGVGIGLIVDNYFGISPFGLIIFFILGALAGFLNVYRVMRRIEKQ